MTDILARLQQIQARIIAAAQACHRPSEAVTLIGVSKYQSVDAITQLYAAGVFHFGENYLQEALSKIQELSHFDICWHFIGHLQTNKTRAVAEHFAWCHTLDQLKTAQRLNDQRPAVLPPLQVCIQVNIDDEDTKSGVALAELEGIALSIAQLPRLQLRGLMCLPRAGATEEETRSSFQRLRETLEKLKRYPTLQHLDTLSMGMSADLESAITEGATFVRIGTALFGERRKFGEI